MSGKSIIIVVAFYILAIIQVSFVSRFSFLFAFGWLGYLNFVALAAIGIALFERSRNNVGWLAALWGGFFLDLYSERFFGLWIVALLAAVFIIKRILKRYVRIPSFW